ncbi:uncharacterized protein LOC106094628 [Stomoxys calcitrans]|uniref:uncharacterized protein LOC106094628 n=1 Tax=Stomoxys calcitrans TaxID=35570 RepID=UPI0027E385EE|nr:uncharacterized protein LOC106094628 [Stomoxys calcitrans]
MDKLACIIFALIALVQGYPTLVKQELSVNTVADVIQVIPSAVSHQSQTVVHGNANTAIAPAVAVEENHEVPVVVGKSSPVIASDVSSSLAPEHRAAVDADIPNLKEQSSGSTDDNTEVVAAIETKSAPDSPESPVMADSADDKPMVKENTSVSDSNVSEAASVAESVTPMETAATVDPALNLKTVADQNVDTAIITPAASTSGIVLPPSEISFHGEPLLRSLTASGSLQSFLETPITFVH